MTEPIQEEPWESEIGSMLGSLPTVEPPAGFIDSALDHRPLHAGRIVLGLLALSMLAFSLAVATDAAGRSRITPDLDDLAQRHSTAVRAGVFPEGLGDDYRIDTPVAMPDGFERTGNLGAEDLRQAVYAKGDTSVSVFVQDGRPLWDSLPAEGRGEIDGLAVWIDPNRQVILVEASNETVTIVGLPESELDDVLREVPRNGRGLLERLQGTVRSITEQLGYPQLDN
ncbi:MAG: hypothetical protein ACRBK7_15860 [Acidimicrobiales bacterium]